MIVTEQQARAKYCCAGQSCPSAVKCYASDCMAWRWTKAPKLSFVRTLHMTEVESITGKPAPIVSDFPASPEAYFAAVNLYMREALEDKAIISALTHVSKHAEWVADGSPDYDDGESLLFVSFLRESDPTATGHCGYIGKD